MNPMITRVAKSLNLNPSDAGHRMIARAAIEAMREPTETMREQGQYAKVANGGASYIYHAMIDAALKE